MITAALTIIGKIISGGLTSQILEAWKLYNQGKITNAEFESRVKISAKEAEAKIETAWADAAAKITDSVQTTVRSSPLIQRAYAIILFLQVFVLVWYQLGVPAYQIMTGVSWPAPGASIEWAYLLIAAMIGAGPLVMRNR